jgi:hypothetical protein
MSYTFADRHHAHRADALIREAHECGQKYAHEGKHDWASHAGHLQADIRLLCSELDEFHGVSYRPPVGLQIVELDWLGQTWQVEVQRSEDGIEFGHMLVNGGWLEAEDIVHAEQLEKWREELAYDGVEA